jgi:two-component system, NtrC family, response regulator AtoC
VLLKKVFGEDRRESALEYYQRRASESAGLGSLLGDSAPMLELKSMIRQVLQAEENLRDSDAPAVLVLGETGTGKELVARGLHFNGPRRP